MRNSETLDGAVWRKSSFSGSGGPGGGNCVEVAALDDGHIAIRNSNNPAAGAVLFTRAEMSAWLKGCQAGEFDGLS